MNRNGSYGQLAFAALLITALFVGCKSEGSSVVPNSAAPPPMSTVRRPSVNPGSIHPAAMVKTSVLAPSAMTSKTPSKTSRMVDVQGPNWTVIPGDGIEVVASPVSWDNPSCTCGQIFVLAASPAGPDKYIWRYDFSDDTWTNMPGEASQLAVGPDGTLYAINSSGAIYEWGGSSWTALAGGANAITVASDGSLYALSNSGGGGDEPIWHYSGGTWTYVPGAGVSLAASWDTQTYSVPGGTVAPGGFYVVNSQG
jgi:hypothetical protein